jgi:hypothetical protein
MSSVAQSNASESQTCGFNSCQGGDLKFYFLLLSLVTKVFKNKCTVYKFSLDNFHLQYPSNIIHYPHKSLYRKPPTISPGLIYFRKQFLMSLYKGGLYTGGLNTAGLIYSGAYTWTIFCVYKQVGHKQVSHKQENKHVLSNVAGLILYRRTYFREGLIFWGVIFGRLIFGMR